MREMSMGLAIPKCYFCGEDKNVIIMNKFLTPQSAKKIEECHGKVIDTEPCDKCKELMKQGVMLIKVKDDAPDWRLGSLSVIKDEAIKRIFPSEQSSTLLKSRAGFIGETLWEQLGLP